MTKKSAKSKPVEADPGYGDFEPGYTTPKSAPEPTACVGGKAHSFKQTTEGGGKYTKPYYEKLRIEEVEAKERTGYDKKPDGSTDYEHPTYRVYKQLTTVDAEPGNHYTTVFCSQCGETKEILVKSHGAQYTEEMLKLTEEQRRELKNTERH